MPEINKPVVLTPLLAHTKGCGKASRVEIDPEHRMGILQPVTCGACGQRDFASRFDDAKVGLTEEEKKLGRAALSRRMKEKWAAMSVEKRKAHGRKAKEGIRD